MEALSVVNVMKNCLLLYCWVTLLIYSMHLKSVASINKVFKNVLEISFDEGSR